MGVRLVHASLLVCAAMWGLVFVGVHEVLPALSAVQIVTARFVIISLAFGLMFLFVPKLRVFPDSLRDWAQFALCGVLAVPGSQLAIVESQRYLAPQLASLVVATAPVMTAVFAALLLGEGFSVLRGVGSVVALVGVAFIVVYGTGDGLQHATFKLPALVAVLTPLSWALYTVTSRPLAGRYPPLATVALCLMLGTVTMLPFVPNAVASFDVLTGTEWAWLVYLALGGSLLPYLIWFASLRVLPANVTAAFMYVIPLFAMLFTWLFLGREPGEIAIVGGAFVLLGVILTQIRVRRSPAVVAPPLTPAEE